jgi:hypothetical protein
MLECAEYRWTSEDNTATDSPEVVPYVRRRRSLRRASLTSHATRGCASAATARRRARRVSPSGADVNTASNCALAAPCRSFGAAIGVTNAGGEIIVLDSAGYGPVAITKSVSIISPPGIYAGVSVLSGQGITINTAGVEVTLRGLTVNGQGGSVGFAHRARASTSTLQRRLWAQGILIGGAERFLFKTRL